MNRILRLLCMGSAIAMMTVLPFEVSMDDKNWSDVTTFGAEADVTFSCR